MEANEFIVGSRYRNRKQSYEVLQIDEGNLHIKFDDGSEGWLDSKTAARIYSNMEREEGAAIPEGLPAGSEEDHSWTLGVIAGFGHLDAEVPPQSWPGFV